MLILINMKLLSFSVIFFFKDYFATLLSQTKKPIVILYPWVKSNNICDFVRSKTRNGIYDQCHYICDFCCFSLFAK